MTRPNTFDAPISGNLTYYEAMYELQKCGLEGTGAKTIGPHNFGSIFAVVNKIDRTYDRVQGHLSSLENCSTFQRRCERYAFRLHASFVGGWLCRGAFRRTAVPESQRPVRTALAVKGKEYPIRSLGAYLNLHPLCLQVSRSGSCIHNGFISALVLGLLGEAKVKPEVRELQGALVDTLSSMDDNGSQQICTDATVTLSNLHSRALAALTSLYGDQMQGGPPFRVDKPPHSEVSAFYSRGQWPTPRIKATGIFSNNHPKYSSRLRSADLEYPRGFLHIGDVTDGVI